MFSLPLLWVLADSGVNGLRHEAAFYTMHPMSFREFLSYESILDKDPIPLEDILANHHDLVKEINAEMNIVPIYRNYLEHGCYPFYWQDPDMYYFRAAKISAKRDLPGFAFGGLHFDE